MQNKKKNLYTKGERIKGQEAQDFILQVHASVILCTDTNISATIAFVDTSAINVISWPDKTRN